MAGECPPHTDLFRAAKILGVAPWVLYEQPIFWKEMALILDECERLRAQRWNK